MRNITFLVFIISSVCSIALLPAFGQQKTTASQSLSALGVIPAYDPEKCATCTQTLATMPPEVRWGIRRSENDIVFSVSDPHWINKLIISDNDGLAVDVVARKSYFCDAPTLPEGSPTRGTILLPVYKQTILSKGNSTNDGGFSIKLGELPAELRSDELEFNLILISNKRLCHYMYSYNIPEFRWGLLDMGLFWDTPRGKERITDGNTSTRKDLKFVIPFEKDKYEYKPADIQPIYDSLKLKHFEVKSVSVRAYASVEGSEERNMLLQRKRAESIIKILQSYQLKGIHQDIVTAENWVEFLQDITPTSYAALAAKNKKEIKEVLQKEAIKPDMEAILRKHRKAVLYLELERKVISDGRSAAAIQQAFQKAISQKLYKDALTMQAQVFSRIEKGQLPVSLLDSLQIPVKAEFGSLLNNGLVFNYQRDESSADTLLPHFLHLRKLLPTNANICYNVCALQIKAWSNEALSSNPKQIRTDILALSKLNIEKELLKRLLINYEIIHCEYLMRERKYAEKDQALQIIFDNYTRMHLSEGDAVNLAHYLYSYSKEAWAIDLLAEYVDKVDVSEDLLFYYLSLTMVHPLLTETTEFRLITLNAANVNRARFCKLFDAIEKGGITFQLLGDLSLKKIYCESCNH